MLMGATSACLVAAFRRIISAGSAALVLALAVFAASPELHAKLHGHDVGHDDGCVVAVFATGVSSPVATATVAPLVADYSPAAIAPTDELMLTAPRYLRQPERGPPALA